jgi:predicted enzyme related to lactoylglutathione lyase
MRVTTAPLFRAPNLRRARASNEDCRPRADFPLGAAAMDPVVHFEMPYDDRARMAKFYEAAFGWRMQMFGEDMGNYVVATTTESGEGGPKMPGAINGGFFPRKADWPAQYPSVVISVQNIRDAIDKVNDAGGKVLGDPMEIPGVGRYVSFTDPEGNRVSMLQPDMRSRSDT